FDRKLSVFQGAYDSEQLSLSLVSKIYYDSQQDATQGVGNGTVTHSERFDGEGSTRVTKMWFDYRDREIGQENPEAPHMSYAYDNLNRVVEQARWTAFSGSTPAEPDTASEDRSTYTQTLYNNRGMVYRTRTAIDPTQNTPEFLETNRWFDEEGLTIATWAPNGPATKMVYDALDRPSVVYQSDRFGDALPGAGSFADASSVADDHVISQVEYSYIPNGVRGAWSAELVTNRARLHDADESGGAEVAGVLDGTNSVATYMGYAYDDAGRSVVTLNYGTNTASFAAGTAAPTVPFDTTRATSSALISSIGFDEWGRVDEQFDPEDKKTKTVYDDLSRQVAVIESTVNIDGDDLLWDTPSANWLVIWPGGASADQDRVTTFTYDGNSNVIKRTAQLNTGDQQVTKYVYGTTPGSSGTPMDTLVGSSSLLSKVHYPNEGTGLADTSAEYTVAYAYNRLGELRGVTDQNGTIHEYTHDVLGRVTADTVTNFGTNIDTRVESITAAFDGHGRLLRVESLDSTPSVVNGVEFEYTPLHQVSKLHQNAFGVATSGEAIEYAYANAAPSAVGNNYTRLSAVRYPSQAGSATDSVQLDYTGVINNRISRLNGMDVPGWSPSADDLVRYTYLGMSTAVKVNYPSAVMGLDYTKASDVTDPTDSYPGFDQYGRVVWHAWVNDGFQAHPTNVNVPDRTPLLGRHYEYDVVSNRTRDWDGRPGAVPADRDWRYEYDTLDRLETAYRGQHTPGQANNWVASVDSQSWDLDMLGNWEGITTDLSGDGLFGSGDKTEGRTHNLANEILTRTGEPGSGPTLPGGNPTAEVMVPSYDAAGNLWKNSGGANSGMKYYHDAWNRLVRIERIASGPDFAILENEFNGLNWRIVRRMDTSNAAYDGIDEGRRYFFNHSWQMIEEHVDAEYGGTYARDYSSQQFWGARYIDDAVAKRIDRDDDGIWNELDVDNLHYLTDVMFSTRVLVNRSGFVQDRLDYTPYGVAMYRAGADVNGVGGVNVQDYFAYLNSANNNLAPGDAGYTPFADLNGDGVYDIGDQTEIVSGLTPVGNGLADGWLSDPTAYATRGTDNSIGYDGYMFDLAGGTYANANGLYMQRHRVYDPGMGRWLEREPNGEMDKSTLYGYVGQRPVFYIDPHGLNAVNPLDKSDCDTFKTAISIQRSTPSAGIGITVSASFEVAGELEYQRCKTCCGGGVSGVEHTLKVHASATGSITVTAGISIDFRMTDRLLVSGYLGIQGEGRATINLGGGEVSWTDCENSGLESSIILCGQGEIGFEARGGMMIDIRVGWFQYQTGAEAYARSNTPFGICLECNTSGCKILPDRSGFGSTSAYVGFNVCAFGGCWNREYYLGTFGGT
ncbi:MAG: hypothetical protein JKY96_08550, partial [Phycisphaerales bacterium]|nr:hypothetical protein [Phycisphaerales bacterium]